MSVKVIEVKVSLSCENSKTDVLKVVAKLQGVDSITVNAEKGTVTIVGTVDPVCVITQLRKAKICAEIISVGPPKKKPDPCKPDSCCCQKCQPVCCKPYSCGCQNCQLVSVVVSYDSPAGCGFW